LAVFIDPSIIALRLNCGVSFRSDDDDDGNEYQCDGSRFILFISLSTYLCQTFILDTYFVSFFVLRS